MSLLSRKNFKEFYMDFGFDKFPFSQFSTENELPIKEKLFYNPSDYAPVVEAFLAGQSMFILGNRGTGKTAMIYDLAGKTKSEDILLAWLDDFSHLSNPFKIEEFYKTIIQKITQQLFIHLVKEKKRIKALKPEEKMLLVYLLNNYFPTVSRKELMNSIEEISHSKPLALSKKVYNFSRDFINYGLSAAMQFSSDLIRQHFTMLPPLPKEILLKQYFPEIPLEAEKTVEQQEVSYAFLNRCLELVSSLGYSRFIFIIDKIDEDSRLKNDAEEIADFIEPVLTDNKLLLNERIQLGISIWTIPFSLLTDKVRSQKHFSAQLSWEKDDLIGALNQRLRVYSDEKIDDYKIIFDDGIKNELFDDIFFLANGNPRDLWHIFKNIFNAQYRIDSNSNSISANAIETGLKSFVEEFNYYEYYPRKIGSRKDSLDIYSYLRHLLRLGQREFNRNQFKEATGVSGGSVSNYVAQMQRMGLLVDYDRDGTQLVYKVVDPKVQYALEKGLSIKKTG